MKSKKKILLTVLAILTISLCLFTIPAQATEENSSECLYLSDIDYITSQSRTAWGTIQKDQANGGTKLTVKVQGANYTFDKGIWAHATSTLVYDISEISTRYDYFTTYMALNSTAASSSNGVKFTIYTSEDGTNWTAVTTDPAPVTGPGANARYVEIPLNEHTNYLKLYADSNGSNGNDHSVYVDAKFVTQEYLDEQNSLVLSTAEYDQQIKAYTNKNIDDPTYEMLLLKREFVSNVGDYALKRFMQDDPDNKATVDWLMSDIENLRYYIHGGTPMGSYYNSLTQLTRLLKAYKSDFNITDPVSDLGATKLRNRKADAKITKGDLYKRMVITLSLTHGTRVGLWMQWSEPDNSDAVVRYEQFKNLYNQGKFRKTASIDMTSWFESYSIEEMRYVMNVALDDESVYWLNDYVQSRIDVSPNSASSLLTPHPYLAYVYPNYQNPIFYSEDNYEYFNDLFAVPQRDANGNIIIDDDGNIVKKYMWPVKDNPDALTYNITRGTSSNRIYKLWMNFRNKFGTGAVCGGISKSGHCIRGVNAIPSAVIGQPGHAALLYYAQDANGNGAWGIDNDVSGWTKSSKGERMPLGWGNASYSTGGYTVSYIAAAQEAMNHQTDLERAQKIMLQAKVYAGDPEKQEQIYREAIAVQSFNLDAWFGLINTYKANPAKTQKDFYDLAVEVGEATKYFPLPMYHLTNLIKPLLTDVEYAYQFDLLQDRILTEGKNAPNNTADNYIVWQPSLTRTMANYLLGSVDNSIASFSFDGNNANKIVLSSRFDGNGIRWDYCLDGQPLDGIEHWKEVSFTGDEEHKLLLTPEEIASITSENDIYVHVVGVGYSETSIFKIDILESAGIPSTLYANDWENRIIGGTDTIQWRMDGSTEYHYLKDEQPDLSGDKTIHLKVAATGIRLASKSETTYTFTTNTDPDTRKYISIDHISLNAFSTEADGQGRYARYAIDGNLNTSWHSNWNGNDTQKFIVFEFDEIKNLTAIEYFPAPGGNGKILSAQVLVSVDGENWTEVVAGTNWTYANTNDVATKTVDFDAAKAKYVKIVGKQTQNSFITAKMFNLYEDTTARIVGTFVFDGEKANKIILDNDFLGQSWEYSVDNGATWNRGNGDEYELPVSHVKNITAENKIKMRFEGNATVYTININETASPTISAYLNDWENRLIGVNNNAKVNLEWQIEGTDTWTDYTVEDPVVAGEKKLYIRRKASLNYAPSAPQVFQFAEDNNTATQTYIPLSHIKLQDYTSQSVDSSRPYYAPNAIDGNANTLWHTNFAVSIQTLPNRRAHYTVKLDEPKAISAVEFMQWKYRDADPALIRNMYVYISDDNVEWVELGRLTDIPQTEREFRRIEFAESMTGQYVKFEMEGYDIFASLSMINLYEDTTNVRAGNFSFDGDNANKIILEENFVTSNWEYSLDGGENWKPATGAEHLLTFEEAHEVNGDNRIKLRINNVVYTVNIQESETPIISAYLNDLENRLIGMTVSNMTKDGLEWKIVRGENTRAAEGWTDYSEEEPVVPGDATLQIRAKARGIFAPSDIVEYQFTDDNQPDTRKYIPVAELSIASVSAEDRAQSGLAVNAIDANYNTRWLNSSAGTDQVKNITIKFDSATYVTAMDYVPHAENGKIMAGTIEGSMDGENFTLIKNITGWANNQDTKTIDFDEPVKVRYIRITGTTTSYTSTKRHIGARMFNFYEDTTKEEKITPTAEVRYSITELTNQDVVATLINESTEITILNNNGNKSYTFTENGEFTFEFEDSDGNKGSTTAKVDWIAKTLPNPTLTYDYPDPTNTDVTVTVTFDVPGTRITNNNGSNTYTFTNNGEFTFEFEGPFGNAGTVTATVDWIIRTLPNAEFTYSTTERTNKPVTVTVTFDTDGTTITNNNGSNTYTFTENGEFTFEFEGPYGNAGVATATVDWIDTTAPTAEVVYNITSKTNQDVVATLDIGDKELSITNNDGSNTYTFTENGTFTFEFVDDIGNEGTAVATVDWIDKVAPTGRITYNIIEPTHQEVIATLNVDEAVTITNNNGSNRYGFMENGEFTFEFVDEAGNTGSTTANVTWIDKSLPVTTITYSTTEPTNTDVVATISFDRDDVVVKGGKTHTFTQNGSYEFEFTAPTGSGVAIATVNWIDKTVPEATVVYSTIAPTNNEVVATVIFENEKEGEVTITNNGGDRTYRFADNGSFTFEFTDRAGNTGRAEAVVNNIDREAPTATVSYSTTSKTNRNVVATLDNISEDITITNNNGSSSHTFTNNGNFTFEFVDRAGNTGRAIARVEWIDKILPTPSIEYSTMELTNEDVIATIGFNKDNVRVDNGKEYTFTRNGEYTFEYTDEAGNNGMATASVDWIDKVAPTATVEYDITDETTGSVVASLVNASETITITNNDGNSEYTFTENGEFTFEFVDRAGNTGTAVATVDWIVPEAPEGEPSFKINLSASKESLNPGDEFEIDISIADLKNIEDGLIAILGTFEYDENVLELQDVIGQNDWNMDENSYNKDNFRFVTENGKYITENGSVIKLKLKVKETIEEAQETIFKVTSVSASNGKQDIDTADKQIKLNIAGKTAEPAKITSEKYNVAEETITRILPGTTFSSFKANVSANRNIKIINAKGEEIGDSDVIATGMTIKVGEELEYSLVVIGDIDKDGKLSPNDLAVLKLHLIEKEGYNITGNSLVAADIDNDGSVGINDVAQLKMLIVGLLELD